ncbi:MAG: hypothetical protein LC676_07240 [Loktanella sp.]|nr:hypothetical protein [Loktanella sp.]
MGMCIASHNVDGQMVNCGKCKACRRNKTDAWTGLAMAEAQAGGDMWSVTLTYRPGETGENFLKKSDVQKMFKRLRYHQFRFRYVLAGELGTKKGRPHWHILIWFQGRLPDKGEEIGRDTAGNVRLAWPFWPHGHAHIDDTVEPEFCSYVCKYIQKAEGAAGDFTVSRKPGIGQEYFDDHARRHGYAGNIQARNWFKVDGYQFCLPPQRWKRYRKAFREAWREAGRDDAALLAFEAYENILLDDERQELEAGKAAAILVDAKLPAARDFQEWFVKVAYRDNQEKGGGLSVQRLSTYERDGVRFMRLEHDGERRWLLGTFHLPGQQFIYAQSGKRARKVDVPISAEQFLNIRYKQRPYPESDPFAQSDWITDEAAAIRKERGLRSVSSVVRRASAKPNYRTPKKRDAHS